MAFVAERNGYIRPTLNDKGIIDIKDGKHPVVEKMIVNDMFGKVSYDKILGVMCAFNYAGYALGAPLLNICYDVYGSSRPILFLLGIVMIPVIILFQVCINLANKEKEKEGKEDV